MASTNLGRVQGAGQFFSTATSATSINLSTVSPTNVKPLVGDSVQFSNGDLRLVTAATSTVVTCGSVVANLKGPQGIQGVKGDTGSQGIQGVKGDKGDTGPQGPKGDGATVALNGSQTASPSFFAPTTAGAAGQILKSNGSGAPSWVSVPMSYTCIPSYYFDGYDIEIDPVTPHAIPKIISFDFTMNGGQRITATNYLLPPVNSPWVIFTSGGFSFEIGTPSGGSPDTDIYVVIYGDTKINSVNSIVLTVEV